MKLVGRAGRKEIGNPCVTSAGENKHGHSSNISTQANAVHAPIMLGGSRQGGEETGREKREYLRVENWGQAWIARGS